MYPSLTPVSHSTQKQPVNKEKQSLLNELTELEKNYKEKQATMLKVNAMVCVRGKMMPTSFEEPVEEPYKESEDVEDIEDNEYSYHPYLPPSTP